jgi:hypothetical protein
MSEVICGLPRRAQVVTGLLALAVLVPPAWAYVNGGDYHNSFRRWEKQLKSSGWGVGHGTPAVRDRNDPRRFRVPVQVSDGLDSREYQRWVDEITARAIQSLPKGDAAKTAAEAKREVARHARRVIHQALSAGQERIKEGRTGALRYQVGAYDFESYWETNYGGKQKIHERQSGLIPFVALQVVDAKDGAEK